MTVFSSHLINGLALGALYSLIVTGLNLLMLIRNVVHFAYAPIVVLGMYAGWTVLGTTGGSLVLAALAALATTTVVLVVTEPLFRPLAKRKAVLETIVVSLGIAMIINEAMSQFLNNGRPVSFPPDMAGRNVDISVGVISADLGDLYAIAGAVMAVAVLGIFMYRTMHGRAFRAMAQDTAAAKIFGIPITRNGLYSFTVAGLLAGVTSMLVAISLGSAGPTLGGSLSVKALVVVLLAGSGNLKGGLISALAIGVLEALILGYLPGRWTEAIVYGAVMVAIIIRPQGLFGARI